MLSFKDYVVIADALEAEQLDEGWMDDAILAIKKKLGGKLTDDEIEAEIEKLKAKKAGSDKKVAGGAERIAQTQQSRDFHARRADMAAKAAARQPRGTVGTGPNTAASFRSKSTSDMTGGELRALDRNPYAEGKEVKNDDPFGKRILDRDDEDSPEVKKAKEMVAKTAAARAAHAKARRAQFPTGVNAGLEIEGDVLAEAQIEFNVKYRAKGSDGTAKDKKTVIKGTDVRNVKDKFRLQYAGWMFISAEPKNAPRRVIKKVEEVQEDQDCGPLGPRS
jgi:hypothetical protein